MNQATQHISPNPALDFANAILAEFNNGLELIEILRDIAEGVDEKATANDRIAANNILLDRGLGKCPKQPPATNPAPAPDSEPDAKEPKADNTPESPRLVTQIDQSLHDSFGAPPSAHTEPVEEAHPHSPEPESPEPLDPFSIQATIQQHILAITNNGLTLLASLAEIARAEDDPKACPEPSRRIKTSHRRRAARILIDRLAGTDLMPAHNAVCPDCRRKRSTHDGSHAHPEPGQATAQVEDLPSDEERWARIEAKFKRMEDEGIITPDPNAPEIDISGYRMPKDFDSTPYEKEEAESFKAEIALQLERQKQWPEIEERRRKKLAQIYPSHSDDKSSKADPPDT